MLSALVVALGIASAVQGRVAVLQPEMRDFAEETISKRNDVVSAIDKALGTRLVPAFDVKPGCAKSVACRKELTETLNADELLEVVATRLPRGGYAEVTLQVYDVDGAPVLKDRVLLADRDQIPALHGLLVRTFAAGAYGGTLDVRGVLDGEEVLVDGLPSAGALGTISVGPHQVTVQGHDGVVRTASAVVEFGAPTVVELPPAGDASAADLARASRSPWPAVFLGGAALVAAGAVPVMLAVAEYNAVAAATYEAKLTPDTTPDAKSDPSGDEWKSGYGPGNEDERVTSAARLQFKAQALNNHRADSDSILPLRIGAVAMGVTALVASAGVIAVVALYLTDDVDAE